jgi:hypothetical protein
MYIERAPRRSHFTILTNDLLQNGGLSFGARGLAGYLLSLPDGRQVDIKSLAADAPDGRQAVAGMLRELETARYLVRVRTRDARGRIQTVCRMHDEPQDVVPASLPAPWSKTRAASGADPDAIDDGISSQFAPKPGLPDFGQPDFGFPDFKELKNRRKNLPPLPPADDPAPDVASPGTDGRESGATETPETPEAAAVVDGLPAVGGRTPSGTHRARLVAGVAERLAQGWTAAQLTVELSRDLGSAQGPGVYAYRLESLGSPPARPAPRTTPKPHAWVDGGANGACSECGSPATARHHQVAQPRPAARCEHGRVAAICPSCTSGAVDMPETTVGARTRRAGASGPATRLSGLLGALGAARARRDGSSGIEGGLPKPVIQ